MADEYTARDGDGIVHSLERAPSYLFEHGYSRTLAMGFTWCMLVFTWDNGPRFHSLGDKVELRLVQTLEHVTCLTCIAAECGTDLLA